MLQIRRCKRRLLAAAHKREDWWRVFSLGEGKKGRKGTCATLIRESHMVEGRGGRVWRWWGGGSEGVGGESGKDVPAFCLHNQEASSIFRRCLQMFGRAATSSHPPLVFNRVVVPVCKRRDFTGFTCCLVDCQGLYL